MHARAAYGTTDLTKCVGSAVRWALGSCSWLWGAPRAEVWGRAPRARRARCVCAPLSCVGFSSDRSISVRVARDCDRAVMSIVCFACEVLRCRSLQYRPPAQTCGVFILPLLRAV